MSGEKANYTKPLQPKSIPSLVDLPSSTMEASVAYDPFDAQHLTQAQKNRDLPQLLKDYRTGSLDTSKLSAAIAHIGKFPSGELALDKKETVEFINATSDAVKVINRIMSGPDHPTGLVHKAAFEILSVYIFEAAEYHASNGSNNEMKQAVQSLNNKVAQIKVIDHEAFDELQSKIDKLHIRCLARETDLTDLTHFVSGKSSPNRASTPSTARVSPATTRGGSPSLL